jgi:hypothetical protein
MRQIEIELPYSLDSGREHILIVKAMYQERVAAKLTGHPDIWEAANGGELEDPEIFMVGIKSRKIRYRRLSQKLEDRLIKSSDLIERVMEKINELY